MAQVTRLGVLAVTISICCFGIETGLVSHAAPASKSRMSISGNGRYFLKDGKPFFWLGDSAWSLFALYTKDEAAYYLKQRRRQGFDVVQIMIPFNGGPGLKTAGSDVEGNLPFTIGIREIRTKTTLEKSIG